jgi:hypothetical protein
MRSNPDLPLFLHVFLCDAAEILEYTPVLLFAVMTTKQNHGKRGAPLTLASAVVGCVAFAVLLPALLGHPSSALASTEPTTSTDYCPARQKPCDRAPKRWCGCNKHRKHRNYHNHFDLTDVAFEGGFDHPHGDGHWDKHPGGCHQCGGPKDRFSDMDLDPS